MLIENALVPVKPIGITLKHYCDLGYDARVGVEIMVKPSELTDGSKVRVIVECDVCHSLYNTPYKSYIRYHTYGIDIEYDGWYWHQDQQRDNKRDRFLQSNGFKVLRIKSARQIPKKKEIFDAIDSLVKTDRIYKEIIMDDWKEVSA